MVDDGTFGGAEVGGKQVGWRDGDGQDIFSWGASGSAGGVPGGELCDPGRDEQSAVCEHTGRNEQWDFGFGAGRPEAVFDGAELAGQAISAEEQEMAREAERLADHEVDQAFAMALRQAEMETRVLTGDGARRCSRR